MSKEIETASTTRDVKVFGRAADVGKHLERRRRRAKSAAESADEAAERTQGMAFRPNMRRTT
jgi:hypothetical protein